eukprot:5030874-Pyramimonas_sp.AAC.1
MKGVPQDRSQRLIILSLREKRLIHKVRHAFWCDTKDMLASSLTKHCTTDEIFHNFLATGYVEFKHPMLVTIKAKKKDEYTEGDLE